MTGKPAVMSQGPCFGNVKRIHTRHSRESGNPVGSAGNAIVAAKVGLDSGSRCAWPE
jgi:hypothetical protein